MIALFFDTETTGFKKGDIIPEIVQIAAILQDTDTKRVLAELNVIVKPSVPIPPVVSEIHGITDDVAARFGLEQIIAEGVFTKLAIMADVIVAHNIAFDLGIIKDTWVVVWPILQMKQQYCTMREGTPIIKLPPGNYHGSNYMGHKPPKLIEAYRHFFNTDFEDAHNAMADVRACRDVYFAIESSKVNENIA